jgi:hypothetical protein
MPMLFLGAETEVRAYGWFTLGGILYTERILIDGRYGVKRYNHGA